MQMLKHGQQLHPPAGEHTGHLSARWQKRLRVSLLLTLPILLLSAPVQQLLRYSLAFPGDQIFSLLLASGIYFYGGWPFLNGAAVELRRRRWGMMVLISLAISVAYFYSAAVSLGWRGEVLFWELATLIDIMLLGHWLEARAMLGASAALEKLSALLPEWAHQQVGRRVREIPTLRLRNGDIVVVRPGEKIPADGLVVGGESSVNEMFLTGESRLVEKAPGKRVLAGAINEDSSLWVEVDGIGRDSYLAKVIALVKAAQASKSQTELLADRAASYLTLVAIFAGLLTFGVWWMQTLDMAFAIERTATVLVIACPHALGLAIPLVAAISTALAARHGFLIRNRAAFENARRVSLVVFDKTGTLTEGNFGVREIFVSDRYDEREMFRLLAGLERYSQHPIAQAIRAEAARRHIAPAPIEKFQVIRGRGIEGVIEGKKMVAASPNYAQELGAEIPLEWQLAEGTSVSLIVFFPAGKKELVGAVYLTDRIRKEAPSAIRRLRREGIGVWMLTGDNENAARNAARLLELDGYAAGVTPDEKQARVREFQARGETVAVVGDGINDAPALAQADVGIAIGSGTDIAAETADLLLVSSNPDDIPALISFARATYRKMLQNLFWAAGYNVFAIPLAAGVWAEEGLLLSPAAGAVLMSLSTLAVVLNAKSLQFKN